MTAALAWNVNAAKPTDEINLIPALKAGLSATRFLREFGHGPVKSAAPGFPFKEAAENLLSPTQKYAVSNVRSSSTSRKDEDVEGKVEWTMLSQAAHAGTFRGPLYGPARRLALIGPVALQNVPCARFEKLLTMDRREIEALRSMRQLMLSYSDGGKQKQPLSLAVFGAPGSGKSFGLKQIAAGVFGRDNPILEFNLSQFKGPEDLIGAYHQVRDQALAGYTPVVFWDEFDSREYVWLQYLLAPMQDGKFQEGQLSHSIGKSVFVFAGGTSHDFANFGPPEKPQPGESKEERDARHDFVMKKGPDFKSRLAGFFDVLGPNPGQNYDGASAEKGLDPWVDDLADEGFPVRRAILLRSLLGLVKERENEVLPIDRGLLTALLEIGHYLNGARSMEKLIASIRDSGGLPLRRAHLPPDSLLGLYVDNILNFHRLTKRSNAFLAQAERLAPVLHDDWRANLKDDDEAKGGRNDKQYDDLDREGKAANIAAARRIPEILNLAGFVLEKGKATPNEDKAVEAFLESNLEFLAEAEHQGWEEQKRMEGWVYGLPPTDGEKRTHPLLIPYSELPKDQKEKDRRTIRHYPVYARIAGFKIVTRRDGDSGGMPEEKDGATL